MESAVRNRGFSVIADNGIAAPETPHIEILPGKRQVIIRENHPSFKEVVIIFGAAYQVYYEAWKATESLDTACKVQGERITFNLNHSVFQLPIDAEPLKKLIAGIAIAVGSNPRSSELFDQFYRLLTDTF